MPRACGYSSRRPSDQELELERLIEHAAIFYLADLDAGRVAERVIGLAGS